jgi:hypothetical protein
LTQVSREATARAKISAVNQRSAALSEHRAADGYVRHKCFVSYHAADVEHAVSFIEDNEDAFIPRAIGVEEDDGSIIDSDDVDYIRDAIRTGYLADSTVTILLVGECTWARKFIDWEIYASLRESKNSTRNGLLGILLPHAASTATAPERLRDNVAVSPGDDAYAMFKVYPSEPAFLRTWIQTAFDARTTKADLIDNSRPIARRNRSCD